MLGYIVMTFAAAQAKRYQGFQDSCYTSPLVRHDADAKLLRYLE